MRGHSGSWCAAVGSELARLRFSSRCSPSAGGIGSSYPSQEETRVVFSAGIEGDAGSDVAMIMCGAGGSDGRSRRYFGVIASRILASEFPSPRAREADTPLCLRASI
jgi:hypothetical protein